MEDKEANVDSIGCFVQRLKYKLHQTYRVKSGIFGQTAQFGQPPCFFHSSIIGIKIN